MFCHLVLVMDFTTSSIVYAGTYWYPIPSRFFLLVLGIRSL